jgi:hypothetical protein
VVKATATKPAEALPSYAGFKSSLLNNAKQSTQQKLAEALKTTYPVVDNRQLYY